MIDKEVNKPEVYQVPAPEGDSTEMDSLRKGRRRFIRNAIVTAPVILTVAARPVWARNCTMSGMLSGNLSDGEQCCSGEGCSPGFWKNHTEKWHYEFPPGRSFSNVFGVDPWETNPSLYDVIMYWTYPEPTHPLVDVLGFHAVAALQNSATAVPFDLTVSEVKLKVYDAYIAYLASGQTNDDAVNILKSLKDELDFYNNQSGDNCPLG